MEGLIDCNLLLNRWNAKEKQLVALRNHFFAAATRIFGTPVRIAFPANRGNSSSLRSVA